MVWTKKVPYDHTHPLYIEFVFMPPGRRLRANKCRTERINRSAVAPPFPAPSFSAGRRRAVPSPPRRGPAAGRDRCQSRGMNLRGSQ